MAIYFDCIGSLIFHNTKGPQMVIYSTDYNLLHPELLEKIMVADIGTNRQTEN